ncbi:MAG TPA: PAS domain S-box protein [Verrucomicrobiae bacterium]|nr:PAS domain S-box protein [Verrucomicrobiae bacterium]
MKLRHEAFIKAQNGLKASRVRFSGLCDISPVGYLEMNGAGVIEEINPSGAKLLGFSRRQLSKHPFTVFIAPEDRKKFADYLRHARRNNKHGNVELGLARLAKNRRIFVELITIPAGPQKSPDNFRYALLDVTARRQVEIALRESEAKFRTLASHAPVGIFLCDQNGKNTFVNECWCSMTGFSAGEACGEGWLFAVHPEDRDRIADLWHQAIEKGIPSNDEFRLIRRDGKTVWVQGSIAQIKDAHGKFAGYIGTIADITKRKNAEHVVMESEKRYRNLIRSLPAAVYTTDAEGKLILFNDTAVELWGRRPEAGKDMWCGSYKIFNPDGTPCPPDDCPMAVTLKTGEPVRNQEIIIERPDGTRRHVLPFPEAISDPSGNIIGAVNMLVDITDRKRAESAAQHLAAIVESSDDAIVGKDLNATIKSWNAGAERVFGYKPEEIIGKSILTIIPPERQVEEAEILSRIHRGQAVKHFETVRVRKDGSKIDVSLTISPVKNAEGKIIGASKIARDITDRKRADQQQQAIYNLVASVNRAAELSEIYELALEAIIRCQNTDRASILLFDADNVMRFKAWRGLSPEYRMAVEGHSPWKHNELSPEPIFIHDIATAKLEKELRGTIEGEKIRALAFIPISYEKHLLGKFMVYYRQPHQFTAEEIRPAETIASQIAFAIERKRVETELKRAMDEAERASRAKDEFLATLSHELRTPLNPVLLLASDAAANRELPPRARTDFDTIRKNIELEARLIDDLLDLTRLSRGKIKLERTVIDVHATLQNAIATVRGEMEQKQIALEVNLKAGRTAVLADDTRLQQIFWNILKNAVKFTNSGGKISVQTETLGDSLFVAKISDTGIGIDPAETEHIFDAFAQGAHSGFGGLGLGLAISRKLIEQHEGKIHGSSEGKGRGATFAIELPLAKFARVRPEDSAPMPGGTTASTEKKSSHHIRILLVEDHEPTRTALTHLLARRNHKVTAASSAAEARQVVESGEKQFDLVISDIGLPDGSGYDLMAELRQHRGLTGIALTGYGMEQDVTRSLESGFVEHLTKPVRMENLDNALGKVLKRPKTQSAI